MNDIKPEGLTDILALAVERMSYHVMITDINGVILYVNPAFERTTGYSRDEMIGQTPRILKSGEQGPEYYRSLWRTILSGQEFSGVVKNKKKTGEVYLADQLVTPIKNETGIITHFVSTWQDITERNAQEIELQNKNEELKRLDQRKDDFVNNVSHELRTPLTIIRENISLMADGLLGKVNERQYKYLDKTLVNVDRLTSIINDLLDISTIESGKLKLNKCNVDFVELVEEVVSNFTPQVEKKGVVIKSIVPNHSVEAFIDKEKMIQVFTNLISNAYKFTDKGSIKVSVSEVNSQIKCCVKDTGIGIALEDLPRLFSKFEKFARQETAGSKGTGLGLSIAKGIVESHEGQITVESEIGQGTQFIVTLPKSNVIQKNTRNLVACLKENTKKYNNYFVLVVSIKNFDVKLSKLVDLLETLIKKQLYRQTDQTVKEKGAVYVILPDIKKENVVIIINRMRQIIHTKECKDQFKNCDGLVYKIAHFPEGSITEQALIANLEINKEDL